MQYLSSDEMAGRGVGTAGEKLATGYIASQLQKAGVNPVGENQTYFQKVPFIGSRLLRVRFAQADRDIRNGIADSRQRLRRRTAFSETGKRFLLLTLFS